METTVIKWDESMAIRCFSKYPKARISDIVPKGDPKTSAPAAQTQAAAAETANAVEAAVIAEALEKESAAKEFSAEKAKKLEHRTYSGDSDIRQWEEFRKAISN